MGACEIVGVNVGFFVGVRVGFFDGEEVGSTVGLLGLEDGRKVGLDGKEVGCDGAADAG